MGKLLHYAPNALLEPVFKVIASYHAPAERHRQMEINFGPLMVRRAHHERMPSPFILSKSKDERAISR